MRAINRRFGNIFQNMSADDMKRRWQEKNPSIDVHQWLRDIGYYKKKIPKDSDSLYRAVSEIVLGSQRHHRIVRYNCGRYMLQSNNIMKLPIECSVEEYAERIFNRSSYGGHNEIALMSRFYGRDMIIVDGRAGPDFRFCRDYGSPVCLYYEADIRHFDLLMPFEYIKRLSYFQSIAYGILYNGVFGMNISLDRTARRANDGNKPFDRNKQYAENNGKREFFGKNRDPNGFRNQSSFSIRSYVPFGQNGANCKNELPHYRIARGLSPYAYKNVEYDSWIESKNDGSEEYHDGITLQVGVKCLCKIRDDQTKPYVCHIQAFKPDGPCSVFIEELGERKTVHSSQLQPLSATEAKPWFSNKKLNTKMRKFNTKKRNVQSDWQLVKNKSYDVRDDSLSDYAKDTNNNISTFSPPPSSNAEWGGDTTGKSVFNNVQCLEKYTRIDYYTFKPPPMEYVAMPLTVETNGNSRDNSTTNRPNSNFNSYPPTSVTTACSSPCVSFIQPPLNGLETTNGSTFGSNSPTPIPTSMAVSSTANSNVIYGGPVNAPAYSPCSYMISMSSMGVPGVRPPNAYPFHHVPATRPAVLPAGINYNAHRSINPNGSDLPYNDIATLRYFFNLGLECMQYGGITWVPPPALVPPTPYFNTNNNGYYYQQTVPNNMPPVNYSEPNNNNGVTENTSMNNRKPDFNKGFHGNSQKPNGKFNGGGRGGHGHGKFRRNEENNDDKTNFKFHFNRGGFNNGYKKNLQKCNNETTDNQEKKNQNQESGQPSESPPVMQNYPYNMSYPPPPYNPFYLNEAENPMITQNYMFGSADDGLLNANERGFVTPSGPMHSLPYVTYAPAPPPPPPYFYQSPNTPNFVHSNFPPTPLAENQTPKN